LINQAFSLPVTLSAQELSRIYEPLGLRSAKAGAKGDRGFVKKDVGNA
jgi:hypothetical protein